MEQVELVLFVIMLYCIVKRFNWEKTEKVTILRSKTDPKHKKCSSLTDAQHTAVRIFKYG